LNDKGKRFTWIFFEIVHIFEKAKTIALRKIVIGVRKALFQDVKVTFYFKVELNAHEMSLPRLDILFPE
jgi:hypothetical protein